MLPNRKNVRSAPLTAAELDRFVTDKELAAVFGCSRSFLQKLRLRGDGPPVSRLGRRSCRYHLGDGLEWLRNRRRAGDAP